MLSGRDLSCAVERRESFTNRFAEKCISDSGDSFRTTHSDGLSSNVRLCDDMVRIEDNHQFDVVGYGTVTVVFLGNLTVELLDVGKCRIGVRFIFADGRAYAPSRIHDREEGFMHFCFRSVVDVQG